MAQKIALGGGTQGEKTMKLLANQVLTHIQRAGRQDDETFDDVLQVRVDGQEVQGNEDDTQDEHAQDDAADLTSTTNEGYAADNAGCDGVGLVVEAGGLGDGADTGSLDEAGEAVHETRQGVHHDGGLEDVDAGDVGRLSVGADSKHVLAEGGLVPDEPHGNDHDDGIEHVPGDVHIVLELNHGAGDEVLVGIGQAGEGLAVVAIAHEEHEDGAVGDQLGGQGDDEGVQGELGHEEAVDKAHDGAHDHNGDDGDDNVGRHGQVGQPREDLVGPVGRLEQSGGDGSRQADHTAGGKVGTGEDDTAADTKGNGQGGRRQGDDVDNGAGLQEVFILEGGIDDENHHQDVKRVVENTVYPETALVFFIHLPVLGSSALDIFHGINHGAASLYVFRSQSHDLFLRGVLGVHFAGQAAAGHDQNPVTHAQQLGHFRRDHQNGLALVGQVDDELIDLILGAHVDAAGGLVQQQHLGVGEEPAAENDLLLVAAGEAADLGLLGGRLGAHGVDGPLGVLAHGGLAEEETQLLVLLEAGDDGIFTNVQNGENAGGAALLGEEGEAVLDGLAAVAITAELAAQGHRAGLPRGHAEDVLQRLGTAAAVQAGKTENFAPAGSEGDVLQQGILGGEPFDLEIDLAGLVGLGRELVAQLTADHQADDVIHLQLGRGLRGHPGAVAHDGDLIGDALDFRHLVRNINDRHAPIPEHVNNLK